MSTTSAPTSRLNPLLRPSAILLAALSLSIGWGIRGNFGHETGAMFPGALTAIAICLLSGREDWRERVPFFACLGALGWGFGGSISYMQVIGYSGSGHEQTQYFGFWGLFFIGFLWAALGAAGTALPAVLDRRKLYRLFKPLSLVLALWAVLYCTTRPMMNLVQTQLAAHFPSELPLNAIKGRHEMALYWFDSDWLTIAVVLVGILAFDLYDRRFEKSLWLPLMAALGGGLGFAVQKGLDAAGYTARIGETLVRHYGDLSVHKPEQLVTNWPTLFLDFSDYAGLALGVILGIALYFGLFGRFRCSSSLFLHMALGWFACFLLFPVLLDVRMTPPRGDNWAGVLGLFVGAMIYFLRNKLYSIAVVSIVAGAIGGLGFSGVASLEFVMKSFGNRNIVEADGLPEAWTEWQQTEDFDDPPLLNDAMNNPILKERLEPWKHWQQANWHSFLEQSYGFVNGLAVILAMALLVRRVPQLNDEEPRQRWTEMVAISLALPILLYVNMVKNVKDWTELRGAAKVSNIASELRAPLFDFSMSTWGWFNLIYGFAALSLVMLMSIHARRRLAIVPSTWLGRGQLLYFVLVWSFALGNFAKALSNFGEQRLLTEGVILVNSVLVTLLILLAPDDAGLQPAAEAPSFAKLGWSAVAALAIAAAVVPPLEARLVRGIYGDAFVGAGGKDFRFGPKAAWKHSYHVKGEPEKRAHF